MTTYLRMEAVNFSSFVLDTNDISTIRGGSLLLLEATDDVARQFHEQLDLIARGASVGLFAVKQPYDTEEVQSRVETFLRSGRLRHATFTVVLADDDRRDFATVDSMLLAESRWKQLQGPSLAFPSPGEGNRPCEEDLLRPARIDALSESVSERKSYGRGRRQSFYRDYSGLQALPKFTDRLDELTAKGGFGNLDGKMAVIYADGNHFGKITEKAGTDSESLKALDARMKQRRQNLLADLLQEAQKRPGFLTADQRLRFETLLWGGDEVLWVVPAWEGWWALSKFFELTATWQENGVPMTHAAGLVFCSHKAPIARIRSLAMELADEAKKKSRKASLFDYAALESFDHTGPDLQKWLETRVPAGSTPADLVLPGLGMDHALGWGSAVKEEFPRKKIFETVRALLRDGKKPSAALPAAAELSGTGRAALGQLESYFGGGQISWVHLSDLWDYLVEEA